MAIAHDADEALRLMDRHICAAHGLGALFGVAFGCRRNKDFADLGHEAARATRTLVAAVCMHHDDSKSAALTDAEVYAMIDSLGDVGTALSGADPRRLATYSGLGLDLRYDAENAIVDVIANPRVNKCACPRGTRTRIRRTPAPGKGSCDRHYQWCGRPTSASSRQPAASGG
jgi:hypothetical protein